MNEDQLNPTEEQGKKDENATERNDTAGPDDDTIGENTEITPLAAEILKEKDAGVQAKQNQENKDFSEKNG